MGPSLHLIDGYFAANGENVNTWKLLFEQFHYLIVSAKDQVEELLVKRKEDGIINSIEQARRVIVGQVFSNLICYVFIHNKLCGNIRPDIFVTNKVKNKLFSDITTIKVGEETQKPDTDIIIYSVENATIKNCIILSLKTSLRERAGQTYRWKLLMEIALLSPEIKEKYQIIYNPPILPKVCFATVDFYDEVDNPQQRGMFKFFDKVFVGKPLKFEFVEPLSNIIEYVNTNL